MKRLFNNPKGFSLVEVLVATAIMGAVAVGYMQMTARQGKDARKASFNMAALDLQKIMVNGFTDSVCTFVLKDKVFDSTNSNASISLTEIPLSASSSGPMIAKVGKEASGFSKYVIVESISLIRIEGTADSFKGNVEIRFSSSHKEDAGKAVSIKPVSVQTTIGTDPATPASAKKILSCSLAGSSGNFPGTLLVLHSQTSGFPSCPADYNSLWTGYSYLGSSGSGGYFGGYADLGETGSCLKRFRGLAVIECNHPNNCDFQTSGDYSYWLSSVSGDEGGMSPVNLSKIGRCRVCVSTKPTTIVVLHSQQRNPDACPSGSNSLWQGFSFSAGAAGSSFPTGGTDIGSTGSCLPVFRAIPFVECGAVNSCDYYTPDDFGFWLGTDTSDQSPRSPPDLDQISRCNVCQFSQ